MATKAKRSPGKPRRAVRLMSWDAEAQCGTVEVRPAGRPPALFALSFVEVIAEEPMFGWFLKCLCCAKAYRGEVILLSGAVECACPRFERDGRCRHTSLIEQMRREGTFPAYRPFAA